jgi:hypothetical protein
MEKDDQCKKQEYGATTSMLTWIGTADPGFICPLGRIGCLYGEGKRKVDRQRYSVRSV